MKAKLVSVTLVLAGLIILWVVWTVYGICTLPRVFATPLPGVLATTTLQTPQSEFIPEVLSGGGTTRYFISKAGKRLTYKEVFRLWLKNQAFRREFTEVLRNSPYKAYFFETPGISAEVLHSRQFEFVLVDSSRLAGVSADRSPFQAHFDSCSQQDTSVSFMNLSMDAHLIAPCPLSKTDTNSYAHLAAFVRGAELSQVLDFFQMCGREGERIILERGHLYTWMSTSGLGVYWLHLRFDSAPKYYSHSPYKN